MLRQCRLETNSKFGHKGTAISQILQPVDMSNLKERELINTLSQNIFQENEILHATIPHEAHCFLTQICWRMQFNTC